VVDDLPKLLAREREAAIRQFMDSLTLETAQTRQLVDQLRGALEAGTETSQSLTTSIRAFDQLMGRFDKPRAGGNAEPNSGRPFNITEYTAAAAEITRSAHELESLLGGVNLARPALVQAAEHVSITLQDAIDRVFWRALELIMLLILAVLTATLTYRGITQRRA
jgi:ABC-type transporter Mla subunit MlaD